MSELTMPQVTKGWLDDYKVGDRVYVSRRLGWTGEQVEVLIGKITKATATKIGVVFVFDEGEERVSNYVHEFRRGRGRSQYREYDGEGRELTTYSSSLTCYPITPEFTAYFDQEQSRSDSMILVNKLVSKLAKMPRNKLANVEAEKLQAFLDEIERANS